MSAESQKEMEVVLPHEVRMQMVVQLKMVGQLQLLMIAALVAAPELPVKNQLLELPEEPAYLGVEKGAELKASRIEGQQAVEFALHYQS